MLLQGHRSSSLLTAVLMLDSKLVQIIWKSGSLMSALILKKSSAPLLLFSWFILFQSSFFMQNPALWDNQRAPNLVHFLRLSVWNTNVNKFTRKGTKAFFIPILFNNNCRNTFQLLILKMFFLNVPHVAVTERGEV